MQSRLKRHREEKDKDTDSILDQVKFSFHFKGCPLVHKGNPKLTFCNCERQKRGLFFPYIPPKSQRDVASSIREHPEKNEIFGRAASLGSEIMEFRYDYPSQEIWWRYPAIRWIAETIPIVNLSDPAQHSFPIWSPLTEPVDCKECTLAELRPLDPEYKHVQKAFLKQSNPKAMDAVAVVKILKNNDSTSARRFWHWRREFDASTPNQEVMLFHGTGKSDWKQVVKNRLDVRASRCEPNSIWGSQFADYCYSKFKSKMHRDKSDGNLSTILAVRFQLGYQSPISETMTKDVNGRFYDSVYHAKQKNYQVFNNAQVHIEYVIQFVLINQYVSLRKTLRESSDTEKNIEDI